MDNNIIYDDAMLHIGATLQMGKYRIDRYLSSGGFGNTYLATNMSFNEVVAIKEFFMRDINLRADNSTTVSVSHPSKTKVFKEQKNKFKVEAQRLRKFKNPHIVGVSDLFDENGTSYYVMDYIDGLSLRDLVKSKGKLEEEEVMNYFDQALDALEEVHNQKIFHLDIKPSNIMVDKNGHVWVIDFGASKQQKNEGGATSMSAVCYTLGYAPIEQREQELEKFGPWTDLYALGATLYRVLTGINPPSTNNILDYGEGAFKFPDNVSKKVKNLIIWMMKGPRDERPQSVAQVREFLKNGSEETADGPDILEEIDDVPLTLLDNDVNQNSEIVVEHAEPEIAVVEKPETIEKEEKTNISDDNKSENNSNSSDGIHHVVIGNNVDEEEIPPISDPPIISDPPRKKKWMIFAACFLAGIVLLSLLFSRNTDTLDSPQQAEIEDAIEDATEAVKEVVKAVKERKVNNKKYTNKTLKEYTYTGPVDVDSLPHGRGEAALKSGSVYTGPFEHGVFQGENAKFKFANGDVFEGSFKDNLFEYGVTTKAANGEYFKGEYKNGMPWNGTWYDKNNKKLQTITSGK